MAQQLEDQEKLVGGCHNPQSEIIISEQSNKYLQLKWGAPGHSSLVLIQPSHHPQWLWSSTLSQPTHPHHPGCKFSCPILKVD